jgi:cupin 2 domain-containing protein
MKQKPPPPVNLLDLKAYNKGAEESFETLLSGSQYRLEKIISEGHQTPPGVWLEQEAAEWVLLLEGKAVLEFEHVDAAYSLEKGDSLFIPPKCRHRVSWTTPDQPTLWLALHIDPETLKYP